MNNKINILDYLITREEYEQIFSEFIFEVSKIYDKNPISHSLQQEKVIIRGDAE